MTVSSLNKNGLKQIASRSIGLKSTALCLTLAGAILVPGAPGAQSRDGGGIQLNFGLTLRLEAQDNRALNPESAGNSFESRANLSFGLLTETRTERLSFDASGALRQLNTPEPDVFNGFIEPTVALSYERTGANAKLSFEASLRENDLSNNALFIDDTGAAFVVSGTATQRKTQVEGRLDLGTEAPFGYGVFARIEDTAYRGGSALGLDGASLTDSRRTTVGLTTRLDLSETTTLNSDLTFSSFEEDGEPGTRETVSLNNRLTLERPLGDVTLGLNFVDTEEGNRTETSLGRTFEMPLGTLSGTIGATRGVNGNTVLTGDLDYRHSLKRGTLTFGLSRDVSSSNDQDTERLSTQLNFGYQQELSPLSSLRFDADVAETKQTGLDLQSLSASVGATYSRTLTRDWNLDVGYRHRYRDSDIVEGPARSNTIFVDLRRVFTGRF